MFLEHLAREKPSMVEELFPRQNGDDGSQASSQQSSSEDEAADGNESDPEDADERLGMLITEERWIKAQLERAESGFPANDEDSEAEAAKANANEPDKTPRSTEAASEGGKWRERRHPDAPKDIFDRCSEHIWALVQRLQGETDQAQDENADENSEDTLARSGSGLQQLGPEEASQKLREMPHEELWAIFRLRSENQRLTKAIIEAQKELENQRAVRGDPQSFLQATGGVPPSVQGVSPQLAAEVRRKVRELGALRKRWWRDRQDDNTTVRRAIAGAQLPEDDKVEDEPPSGVQEASLFRRIHNTMMLP
mmetsp:Transcript_84240/g.238725  ORF Transcript_84240/g.238725 Transcript_84240/m.238725 type:complete len:309 (+) Transcript_84240:1-927(+)